MKLAIIEYKLDRKGSRFEVLGPQDLFFDVVLMGKNVYDYGDYKTEYLKAWDIWGVKCGVTGEFIS